MGDTGGHRRIAAIRQPDVLFAQVIRDIPGKSPSRRPEPQPLVRNVLTRIFFDCMLLELSTDEIRDFFASSPLEIDGRELTESELYTHLRTVTRCSPQVYLAWILRELEPFLVRKNKCLDDLLLRPVERGSIFGPDFFLWCVSHFLTSFSREHDIGAAFLRVFAPISNLLCPHSYTRLERITPTPDGKLRARILFTLDRNFNHAIPPQEWAVHLPMLKYLPVRLGGIPYEQCVALVEMRPATEIAGQYRRASIDNGKFYVDGECFGECRQLHEHLRGLGVSLRTINPPETTIVVISRDLYCLRRKRIVLRNGTAYGSPLGVIEILHCPTGRTRNTVTRLASELFSPAAETIDLESRFHTLLQVASFPLTLVYDHAEQALIHNGKRITSGVQAQLVREILHLAINEKRDGFYRRELARKQEFIIDPFSTGLSVRLNRAVQILQSFHPHFSISKQARGYFITHASPGIRLIER